MYKKLSIIIPFVLLFVFGFIQLFSLIPVIDNFLYDHLLSKERKPAENIIIVGIDERSITEIGKWPWPRFYIADAIEKVADSGAAAIGVNVLYDTKDENEEYNQALVTAASKTDRLVLASVGEFDSSLSAVDDIILPFDELEKVVSTGFINIILDRSDGVLRRSFTAYKWGDITVHSLPFEVYKTYIRVTKGEESAADIRIPLDEKGCFLINYAAKPESFTMVSLWDVINDNCNTELFRDAIVLIGPYAEGISSDSFPTSLEKGRATYSVEINANIIQTMIEGNFKQNADAWMNSSIMAMLGIIAIILFRKLKPLPAAIAMALLIAVGIGSVNILYSQLDMIIKIGDCIIFILICYALNLALGILSAQGERQYIKGLFGRYVSPEVVEGLVSGGVKIALGGIERDITVLFVDVRGFTAFSEENPPEKVVNMINRYLSLTSGCIQEQGGTIDKYIGDATMAVFNAPNELQDHALRAVRAAWAMKQGSLALRKEILRDYGVDLQFGIGINTGSAIIGNMGSKIRMDYTAIGDTVNTAARLESDAGKGQVLLSAATYELVKNYVKVTDLGIINVKNKKVGIRIYNLEGISL